MTPTDARRDDLLVAQMRTVRAVAVLGWRARGEHGIPSRRPLPLATLVVPSTEERAAVERFAGVVLEVLNVKRLRVIPAYAAARVPAAPRPREAP